MSKIIDLTNKKFGKLTVISISSFKHHHNRSIYWNCICDCGNKGIYNGYYLRNGDTQSCGCRKIAIHTQRLTKHGWSGTSTYSIWKGMINRCTNPNFSFYPHYGGRGIKVCKEWQENFINFLNDMGEKPFNKSLDRIDNFKGYSPDNCRWASAKTQARNTRRNIKIGEIRNGWKIIERITVNNIYKAKAQCIKCNRIVTRTTDNLTHRPCHCSPLS